MRRLQVERLLLQVALTLKMKHDSLDYPIGPGALLSEKSPHTALAAGRFGRGVAIAFVDVPPAVHTGPDRPLIGSSAGRGFQRSAWIIVARVWPMMPKPRKRLRPPVMIWFDSETAAI